MASEELASMRRYRRAADYLAAVQIYLRDNVLVEEPLRAEHIKPRLLGHWGTVPGIDLVYTHLNRVLRRTNKSALLVTGPGHGAPANLANLWLEGSLEARYPELTLRATKREALVQAHEDALARHAVTIRETDADTDEITKWRWTAS